MKNRVVLIDTNLVVDSLRAFAIPDEDIVGKLIEKYQLTKDEADVFIKQN